MKKRILAFIVLYLSGLGIDSNLDIIALPKNYNYESKYYENKYNEIKKENVKISARLDSIEKLINKFNKTDYSLYSEIMGVENDSLLKTMQIPEFKKNKGDTTIEFLDERTKFLTVTLSNKYEKFKKNAEEILKNKSKLDYYPFIPPLKTSDFILITSGFGWRRHPIYHRQIFHEGIDISAKKGSLVYSTANGTIKKVLYSKYGYGNRILVKHENGYETLYAHLGKIYVKNGDFVKKGQPIGTISSSGLSTGPHLHYEIHKNNIPVNPMGYFYSYLNENN